MMARMQISIEPDLQREMRRKAAELGISIAEYVRQLIGQDLGNHAPTADASRVFNLGRSGGTNIARDKDQLVAAAIVQHRGRRRS